MELDEYLPALEKSERPVRRRGGRGGARPRLGGARCPAARAGGWPTWSGTWPRCSTSGPGWCAPGRRTRRPTPSRRGTRTTSCSASWPRRAPSWRRRWPAPTRPSGSGPGRPSRTSPSCCAGRPRRRPCTPSTSSRCSATSARSRPTSASTASTSGWRSWCPARCPTARPADAHPVVFHAVDADAERTLFPGTPAVPDRRAHRHRRRPAAGGVAAAAAGGAHRGRRRLQAAAMIGLVTRRVASLCRRSDLRRERRCTCRSTSPWTTTAVQDLLRRARRRRPGDRDRRRGCVSTLLPFVYEPERGPHGVAARALRPQQRPLAATPRSARRMVILRGPDAYITPQLVRLEVASTAASSRPGTT